MPRPSRSSRTPDSHVVIGTAPPTFEGGIFTDRFAAVAEELRTIAGDRPMLDIAKDWQDLGVDTAGDYYIRPHPSRTRRASRSSPRKRGWSGSARSSREFCKGIVGPRRRLHLRRDPAVEITPDIGNIPLRRCPSRGH